MIKNTIVEIINKRGDKAVLYGITLLSDQDIDKIADEIIKHIKHETELRDEDEEIDDNFWSRDDDVGIYGYDGDCV